MEPPFWPRWIGDFASVEDGSDMDSTTEKITPSVEANAYQWPPLQSLYPKLKESFGQIASLEQPDSDEMTYENSKLLGEYLLFHWKKKI